MLKAVITLVTVAAAAVGLVLPLPNHEHHDPREQIAMLEIGPR